MGCLYLLLVAFHFNAGCSLSGEQSIKEVRGHTGGSVVLPCSCTDLQTKPQRVTWQVYRGKEWTEVFSADEYRDRLQQLNEESPANLSLLISDLREEDEGDYRCQTEKESRFFSLFVKVRETPTHLWTTDRTTTPSVSPSDLPTTHQQAVDLQPTPSVDPPTTLSKSPTTNQHTTFSLQLGLGILVVLLLLLFGVVMITCWRHRGRRSRQNVTNKVHLDLNRKQENQTVSDDVTYSKVTHSNTATPARVQISTGEQTEYACIKTN
ncbi:uncharacterized protein LOC108439572 isoform X6 [Pygocentrus nattereri]|uniref:uncharacterized protein LOC108439572 isoform X6 n=1 Tax=Pygocentrus nattereri TaxID=42514 RepID=UPI001891B2C0|nr:uncharacterized protein LOC108439572 isoform X6 [Pygocentrus nattereri]